MKRIRIAGAAAFCILLIVDMWMVGHARAQEKEQKVAPPVVELIIALDPSFGRGGMIAEHSIPTAPQHDRFLALTMDREGRPIAAGNSSDLRFSLARYTSQGQPDATFGRSGKASIFIEDQATLDAVGRNEVQSTFDVTIDSKDRIIVVGKAIGMDQGRKSDFVVLRFDTNGSLDKTFCKVGYQKFQAHEAPNLANAVAAAPDGSIFVAGYASLRLNDPLLIHFKEDGQLDEAFSGAANGSLRWLVKEDASAIPSAIAMDRQGRCVVAMQIQRAKRSAWGVARLKNDGEIDDSFGEGGLWTGILDEEIGFDVPCSVAVDAQGRIVVGGYSRDSQGLRRLSVARLREDGKLDASFGPDGQGFLVLVGYGANTSDGFGGRAAVFKDRIAVIGPVNAASGNSKLFGVVVIANDGKTVAKAAPKTFPGSKGNDLPRGVAFDPDGRIVVSGASQSPSGRWRFAIARYVVK